RRPGPAGAAPRRPARCVRRTACPPGHARWRPAPRAGRASRRGPGAPRSPAVGQGATLVVARRGLDAHDRPLVQLVEGRRTDVGRRRTDARRDLVEQVLDTWAPGVEVHPRVRDALLVQGLARALERGPA